MDVLFHISLVTASVCAAAMLLRRVGRKTDDASIEAGQVSSGWLAEHRVRGREWSRHE